MARHFQDWLKAYLTYTEFSESPDSWHFWTGVATIAGALRGKTWFDMGGFKWTPNFYVILVGPAGMTKGTAMNYGMRLLRQVEGIHTGSDSFTWQSIFDEFQDAKVGELLDDQSIYVHSSVTFPIGELGTALDPKNQELMSLLTALWGGDGSAFATRRTRKDGKTEVENPFLNIIAATTPEWIATYLPANLIGTGFTSRCLFVYEDNKRCFIAYPKQEAAKHQQNGHSVWDMATPLIEDLTAIASLTGEFRISPEAIEYGTEWYLDHHKNPPVGLSPEEFGAYCQRKQAHVHKVAMVMCAARGDCDMTISRADLELAVKLLNILEVRMPMAFRNLNQGDEMRPLVRLLERIQRLGKVNKNKLYSEFAKSMRHKEFEEAISGLERAMMVSTAVGPTGLEITWKGAPK